jgi:hypothetical protein
MSSIYLHVPREVSHVDVSAEAQLGHHHWQAGGVAQSGHGLHHGRAGGAGLTVLGQVSGRVRERVKDRIRVIRVIK